MAAKKEIKTLRGGHEFQFGSSHTGKRAGVHQLAVLLDVELIGQSGFVLIVNYAGPLPVIIRSLGWKNIFITFWAILSRGNNKFIVWVHEDQVAAFSSARAFWCQVVRITSRSGFVER